MSLLCRWSRRSIANMQTFLQLETLKVAWSLLTSAEKIRVSMIIIHQFLLSILDLIAISLFGLVSSLALTGIQSKNNLPQVQQFLELIGIEKLSLQTQVATVTAFAGALLILKTVVSAWIYKRILFFEVFVQLPLVTLCWSPLSNPTTLKSGSTHLTPYSLYRRVERNILCREFLVR